MEALRTENSHKEHAEPIGEATYSPEDNKLRLYPDERLDAETYARVKAAGTNVRTALMVIRN